MNKDQLWDAYRKRNPAFSDDDAKIKITVGALRRIVEQAYDTGKASGGGTPHRPFDVRDLFRGV